METESTHGPFGRLLRNRKLKILVQGAFFMGFVRPFLALFLGMRVHGREHLPASDPFILIANHSSHLDAASLLSLFPASRLHRIRPVAAADYFERNAALRWFSRTIMHILPIARHAVTRENDPLKRMIAPLERGESLILFPEGTRGTGEEIGHFHAGIAHLARKEPDVPIVPVYLHNLGRSLPKGQWIPLPLFCEVRIGAPMQLGGSRKDALEALEQAVKGLREECLHLENPSAVQGR